MGHDQFTSKSTFQANEHSILPVCQHLSILQPIHDTKNTHVHRIRMMPQNWALKNNTLEVLPLRNTLVLICYCLDYIGQCLEIC